MVSVCGELKLEQMNTTIISRTTQNTKKRNNNHHNRWRNENAAMPFKDGVKTDVTWENDRWKRS